MRSNMVHAEMTQMIIRLSSDRKSCQTLSRSMTVIILLVLCKMTVLRWEREKGRKGGGGDMALFVSHHKLLHYRLFFIDLAGRRSGNHPK